MDWLAVAKTNINKCSNLAISEADTQRLIIEPLLNWLGYDTLDPAAVSEQVSIVGAGRSVGPGLADYEVSGPEGVSFVIEAKAIKESGLSRNSQAVQQLHAYCSAHQMRPRWGVLTNGQEWHLYDMFANGTVFDRRIISVDVTTETASLLNILRWDRRGLLESFARNISDARSIANVDLREISIAALDQDLRGKLLDSVASSVLISSVSSKNTSSISTSSNPLSKPIPVLLTGDMRPSAGSKPVAVTVQGRRYTVSSWADVISAVVVDLMQQGRCPSTIHVPKSKRLLVSPSGQGMTSPRSLPGHGVQVETNWSAQDSVRRSRQLLVICGFVASDLTIEIRP